MTYTSLSHCKFSTIAMFQGPKLGVASVICTAQVRILLLTAKSEERGSGMVSNDTPSCQVSSKSVNLFRKQIRLSGAALVTQSQTYAVQLHNSVHYKKSTHTSHINCIFWYNRYVRVYSLVRTFQTNSTQPATPHSSLPHWIRHTGGVSSLGYGMDDRET